MEEMIEVISLEEQHPDGGGLWYAANDPETAMDVFNFINGNVEMDEPLTIVKKMVSKSDFERAD